MSGWLADRFQALGFRIEHVRDERFPGRSNLICKIGPDRDDRRGLVLSGHMDVVPTEGQPWKSDPFDVLESNGLLYGRGTADMKGFFATVLAAAARFSPSDFADPLVLVWTHDEEVGCLGSAVLADVLAERHPLLPTACVIGEPTGFRVLRMHPGHAVGSFRFIGEAAHSSKPELGENAIEKAAMGVLAVRRIAEKFKTEHMALPLLERPWVAVNTATIRGGSAINIVPDGCEVQVGFRPLPGQSPEAIFNRIVNEVRKDVPDVEVELLRTTPSMLTRSSAAHIPDVIYESNHNHCEAGTFATDGGNFQKLGLEPIIFGPGFIEVAHQANEHVPLRHLERGTKAVFNLIAKRCIGRLHGAIR